MLRAGLARRARRDAIGTVRAGSGRAVGLRIHEGRTHDRGELLVDGFVEVRLLQEGNRLVVGGFLGGHGARVVSRARDLTSGGGLAPEVMLQMAGAPPSTKAD